VEYLAREQGAAPGTNGRCALVAESFEGKHGRLAEALARVARIALFRMHVERSSEGDVLIVRPHDLPDLGEVRRRTTPGKALGERPLGISWLSTCSTRLGGRTLTGRPSSTHSILGGSVSEEHATQSRSVVTARDSRSS
jgi:hypothetical protein